MVVHVPGAVLATNAPSRDKELDPEACKATYAILYERWTSLRRMNDYERTKTTSVILADFLEREI